MKKKFNNKLTPRELKILLLLCNGLTNNEIAYKLGKSVRTIENHRASIIEKMEAKNTIQAVCFALKKRIIKRIDI